MKLLRVVLSFGVVMTLACGVAASASASPASPAKVRDGVYGTDVVPPTGGSLEFSVDVLVVDNGAKALAGMKEGGVACTAGPSFIALDPNELTSITTIQIFLPRAMPITPSGTFSFTGNVTLTPGDTQTSMTFTEPITWTGRFNKGKLVKGKTIAFTGTFSAPDICSPSTPTTYRGIWAPKTATN
jgi:hypothetical protein